MFTLLWTFTGMSQDMGHHSLEENYKCHACGDGLAYVTHSSLVHFCGHCIECVISPRATISTDKCPAASTSLSRYQCPSLIRAGPAVGGVERAVSIGHQRSVPRAWQGLMLGVPLAGIISAAPADLAINLASKTPCMHACPAAGIGK